MPKPSSQPFIHTFGVCSPHRAGSRQKAGLGGSQQPWHAACREGRSCAVPRRPRLRPPGLTALVAPCRGSLRGILRGAEQADQALHRCSSSSSDKGKGPRPLCRGRCPGLDKPVPSTHSRAEHTPAGAPAQHPAGARTPPRERAQPWNSLKSLF